MMGRDQNKDWEEFDREEKLADAIFDVNAEEHLRQLHADWLRELGLGRPPNTEKKARIVEAVRKAIAAGARKPDAISLAAREFKQSKDWVRKLVRAADKKNKT